MPDSAHLPDLPVAASSPGRPFGEADDLDLDFGSADRPALVSALLEGCRPAPPGHWWRCTVGQRTAALIDLLRLTERRDAIELNANCSTCGEAFGFELPLAALPSPDADLVRVGLDGGREVELRRPCGEDLRRWRALRPASRPESVRAMIETLCVAGEAGDGDAAALAAHLAEADPLVDFEVDGACPACGASTLIAVDLETLALSRFAAGQRRIEADLHRLARAYGWTEAQSLAVPPARRRRYLALIDAEAER